MRKLILVEAISLLTHFVKKMIRAGGEKFTLSSNLNNGKSVEGIVFDVARLVQTDFHKALTELGINKGSGFSLEKLDEKRMVLIKKIEVEPFKDLIGRGMGKGKSELKIENLDTEKECGGGTIILSSGNVGTFEMHKREMLYYLMNGMNVMGFNVRGYGESTGTPTEKGVMKDFEAVYDYLQNHHPVDDKKILLKALCITGGPAANLAAKHPEINVLLDQSYSDFKNVVEDAIIFYGKKYGKKIPIPLKNKLVRRFAKFAAKEFSPDWKTANYLKEVRGHIGVLWSLEDDLMPFTKQIEGIITAGEKAASCSAYPIPGKHGENWLNATIKEHGVEGESNDIPTTKNWKLPKKEKDKVRSKSSRIPIGIIQINSFLQRTKLMGTLI